eukprot:766957-Hanusia_phi.AAC.3
MPSLPSGPHEHCGPASERPITKTSIEPLVTVVCDTVENARETSLIGREEEGEERKIESESVAGQKGGWKRRRKLLFEVLVPETQDISIRLVLNSWNRFLQQGNTSMGDVKRRISSGIKEALKALTKDAPIGTITRRNIKDHLRDENNINDEDIQEHSEYFKEEVQRLFLEVQREIESKSKGKEKRQNPDSRGQEEKAESVKKRIKTSQPKSPSESDSGGDGSSEEVVKKSTKAKKSRDKKTSSESKQKSSKVEKETAKAELSEECQRLKDLAKKCELVVPVNCFKGEPDSDELAKRIGKYLLERGLPSLNPSRVEIAQFKRQVELSRELDGIDTSNIVRSSRRHQNDDDSDDEKGKAKPRRLIISNSDSDE